MNPHTLIHRYFLGEATKAELEELDRLLAADPELRRRLIFEAEMDAGLREIALERKAGDGTAEQKIISPVFRPVRWVAAAAIVILAALGWSQFSKPKIIATLVSAEDASWESALPTAPGSKLTSGHLKLDAGLATIRFRSGAEMTLEAPAELTLISAMRARLASGAAVMNVPESAVGFVLETPDGYVVDHGTSFAVNVAGDQGRSNFELIEGEISVHVPATGEEVRLIDQQGARITEGTLSTYDGPLPEEEQGPASRTVRIGTDGRATSVIRANREKWLHPDKLMVKRKKTPGNHDRRAFFSFDVSGVDLEAVKSVRIRLNQVPSGIGYASHLPKISHIAVYGLTNPEKADWKMDTTWEEAPAATDGRLLGHFALSRSRQRGSRFFQGAELLEFLKANGNRTVTFILDGEVDPVTGELVSSLVHAFASDTHPEAAGPMLEFTMRQ